MTNLGLPYMGSKNSIARQLIERMPSADTFVDLFAGGCSMTHAAMLSGKYKHFIANDLSDIPQLFADAVAGKYRNEERWISREDFEQLKDSDPYVRVCWSFGNRCKTYLYGRTVEAYKRAFHYAVMWGDFRPLGAFSREVAGYCAESLSEVDGIRARRQELGRALIRAIERKGEHLSEVQIGRLRSLESMQGLERVQDLVTLSDYEQPRILRGNYWDAKIPTHSVVYCAPPYFNTTGYSCSFSHGLFYEWLRGASCPVYISEYGMPEDFVCVYSLPKMSALSPTHKFVVTERLFVHESQQDHLREVTKML